MKRVFLPGTLVSGPHAGAKNTSLKRDFARAMNKAQPTATVIQIAAKNWMDDQLILGTISAEHYHCLADKRTFVTTDNIGSLELWIKFSPSVPPMAAIPTQDKTIRHSVLPGLPLIQQIPLLCRYRKLPSSQQGHEHQSLLTMSSNNIPSTQLPTAQGLANTTAPSVIMPPSSSVSFGSTFAFNQAITTSSSTTLNLGQPVPKSSSCMSSYTAHISTAPTPSNQLPGLLALRSEQMAQPLQLHMPPPACTSRPSYEQLTPLPKATLKRSLPNPLPEMPPAQCQLKSLPSPKRWRTHTNTTVVS